MIEAAAPHSLGSSLRTARQNRGWFAFLGVFLIVLGGIACANLAAATLASVLFVGAMMLVSAGFQLVHAFTVPSWGKRLLWVASALLYAAAGAIEVSDPILGSLVLSALLGIALMISGASRIGAGFAYRNDTTGWGWIFAGGVMTFLVGVLIIATWPAISLTLLGVALAFDLLFQGGSLIALSLALGLRRA
jgi:uncharacterized membrane protein HdeD (DUF308 family)